MILLEYLDVEAIVWEHSDTEFSARSPAHGWLEQSSIEKSIDIHV